MKKRYLSAILVLYLIFGVLPATAMAAEHSHDETWKAVTMGETYIKIDEEQQDSNTLSDGSYYLGGGITVPLTVSGEVDLCLNGNSITASGASAVTVSSGASLTLSDCGGGGKVSYTGNGSYYGVYNSGAFTLESGTVESTYRGVYNYGSSSSGSSDGTFTMTGGSVEGASSYGVYNSGYSSKSCIKGGTVTGGRYGIYNYYSSSEAYLSGSPSVNGGTADIYTDESSSYICADDGAESDPAAYSGEEISLAYYSYTGIGNAVVYNVTDDNKDSFILVNPHYGLNYDGGMLKIQGKPQVLTWYDSDGTTELEGEDYPASVNSGVAISLLPTYTAEDGFRFNGWLYRASNASYWSSSHWSASSRIESSMEFKADVVRVYDIAVGDGSDLSFTVSGDPVTQAAYGDYVAVVSGSEDYFLEGVTVTTASGETVRVSSVSSGYRFTMPEEAVTVTAAMATVARSGARVYTAGNGDVFLGGDYIELGLRPSGVFGTAASAPTSGGIIFHPRRSSSSTSGAIGLRSNGDQKWSEGIADGNNETMDFFLPGTIDEGWVVGWSESDGGSAAMRGRAQASGSDYSDTVTAGGSVEVSQTERNGKTVLTAVTTAAVADTVGVEQTISFDEDGKYFTTSVTLTNNGESPLYDLSYIRAFDPDQRSGVRSSPSSASTDNYFYKDSQGNIWVIAFGNNSLSVGESPVAVSFADMVVNNTAAITPFVFCAKPGDSYTVQAVNTKVGWSGYSEFYRGSSSYQAGDGLYGKHYYADKGIGLEFIVNSLDAGESVTFSWLSSLDTDLLGTIDNVRDEIGVVPPALDGVTLSLSANVDAQGGNKKIDVSAAVKDAAGVDDSLYYSCKPEGGGESEKGLLQTVAANGGEQALAGAIDLSGFANGTYTFCFWVGNSEGVTSARVEKEITVSADGLSGSGLDTAVLPHYTVTFDAQGGSSADAVRVRSGGIIAAPPTTSRTGYTFGGWYRDAACTTAWDFSSDTVAGDITLYAKWTQAPTDPTYDISGTVEDSTEGGVTIKLMQGNTQIGEAKTVTLRGSGGAYAGTYSFTGVPPGAYNVVAVKGDRIVTILVTVAGADAAEQNLTMPGGVVNSKLEITGEGSPNVVVGGLDAEAQTVRDQDENSGAAAVAITMTVEKKAEAAADNAAAIKEVASGKHIDFLDIKVEKKVDDESTAVTETVNLLTVIVPFDFAGKDRSSVGVYRYHGGRAEALPVNANGDGEYFAVGETDVTIYARKFSTYAIGWAETAAPPTPPRPSSGGSGGGAVYPITPPDGVDNGTATVSHKTAARGMTVTITVKPDEGYQLGTLTVTDAKGNALKLTDRGGGEYTFTMHASKVTVSAAFVKANGGYAGCPQDETCPIWPFADADTTAWYHDGVHFCLDNGLMGGYGSGLFGPNNTLSRAMLAQILYNNEGRPAVSGQSVFTDVAEDAWYADAVIWASANGIVGGYGNGEFGPGDPITREQLAVMLYRYVQRKGGGFTGMWMFQLDFDDASAVSEYAYEAMCWCNMNGVVNGYGDKTLRLKNTATRAQAAQMLKNFIEDA